MNSIKPTLHLICGLPGSGKSTLAQKLELEIRALRFSPDDWLVKIVGNGNDEVARTAVESIQWDLAQKALTFGLDIILEFGFWSRSERETYREVAEKLGARTKIHYLNVPTTELKKRIEKRNANISTNGFFVDPNLIDEWAKSFEAPTDEELSDQ